MNTIGGTIPTHNCLSLDYCIEEAIRSLLAFCDELVIADAGSTDGTRDFLDAWAAKDNRVKVIPYEWGSTHDPCFVAKWNNHARSQLKTDMQFYLQADEVVHERDIHLIRQAVETKTAIWCYRLNFWKDPYHMIPQGTLCGYHLARCGPADLWMCEDAPKPVGDDRICQAAIPSDVMIHHYGFIRPSSAYFEKSKQFLPISLGSYPEDLKSHETTGKPFYDMYGWVPAPYCGTHPLVAHEWLRKHGFDPVKYDTRFHP